MYFCNQTPTILHFFIFLFFFIVFNNDMWRKPHEISQFGKKSAKVYHSLYSSTEQLQVALWTYMFFKLGWNKEKCLHTLPLQSLPLLSLHLQFLPLPTLRLVLLVSLIIKTYRISQCSFCIFSGALYLAVQSISDLHAYLNRPVK